MSDTPLETVQIRGSKPPLITKPRSAWVHVNHGRSSTMDLVSHGSPSLELVRQNARKDERKRPKSMPADMKVRFGGGYCASPRISECERVRQVKSAGHRHDLNRVEGVTPIVLGPGYVLSRSKEKVEMTINTSDFFSLTEKERPKFRSQDSSKHITTNNNKNTTHTTKGQLQRIPNIEINIHQPHEGMQIMDDHDTNNNTKQPAPVHKTVRISKSSLPPALIHLVGSRTPELSEKDLVIAQLRQQINDLDMYLQEERINRKLDERKAEDDMKSFVEQIQEEHREHIKSLEDDHYEEIEKLKNMYESKNAEVRAAAEAEISTVKGEMEFLQGAFESYKENVAIEMDKKWEKREKEIQLENDRLAGLALSQQRSELASQKDKEIESLNSEHQRQMQVVVESHRKDMTRLINKFSKCEEDSQQLKSTLAELQKIQTEHDELKETYSLTSDQLKKVSYELKDVQVKLQGFEHHFAEKVQEVDNKYVLRIQNLIVENTEMRHHLLKKCEELFSLQALKDMEQEGSLKNAKETMQTIIKTRAKANVSLTALRSDGNKTRPISSKTKKQLSNRPFSAPSTSTEVSFLTDLTSNMNSKEPNQTASDSAVTVKDRPKSSIARVSPRQSKPAQTTHEGQNRLTLPPM